MTTTDQPSRTELRQQAVDAVLDRMRTGFYPTPEARADAIVNLFLLPTGPAFELCDTLTAAKDETHTMAADGGVSCPCCGQYARVYRRQVNASMARKLIVAWQLNGHHWFSMPALVRALDIPGRDEAYLVHWGLIEEGVGRRADGGHLGEWRVTPLGYRYITEVETITKYVELYNGKLVAKFGPQVSIRDALGKGFDLAELLAGR